MRRELLGFLLVGGLSTVLHYAVLIALRELLGMDAVLASTVGYLSSSVVNYLMNRRFTWPTGVPHGVAVWRYSAVLLSGLFLNMLGMRVLHGYLQLQYVISQVLTTMLTLVFNFSAHRYWTFIHEGRAE